MTTDLQGVALVITAIGSAVASVLGGWAVIRAGKTQTTAQEAKKSAENAVTIIKEVGANVDGRLTLLLETKDKLTEARVDGSYEAGVKKGHEDNQDGKG